MRSSSTVGGHGHGRSLSFHLSLPNIINNNKKAGDHGSGGGGGGGVPTTPKGCIAVRVGEELQRFYVPVGYLNHPLFARLLKEAEEEYGFEQQGAITIPCHVEYFRQVRGMIDKESSLLRSSGGHHHHHHHHHHHQQQHHLPLSGCFRA